MNGTLLFGVIGKEALVDQTICSALSIYQVMGERAPRIVLVTDMAARFARLIDQIGHPYLKSIQLDPISAGTAREWMAGCDYAFRLKIKLIQYYMKTYGQDLLFFDGDTYLRRDISHYCEWLENRQVILYQGIRPMGSFTVDLPETYPGFERLGPDEVLMRTRRGEYVLRSNMTHYNSGVIGMPLEYAPLLDEVLDISDRIYERAGTVSAEEYAFSIVFQSRLPAGSIRTACGEVAHYVYYKDSLWLLYHTLPLRLEGLERGLKGFLGRYGISMEEFEGLDLQFEEVSDAAALFHMHDKGVALTVDNYYLFALRFLYTVGDRNRFYSLYFRLMNSPVGQKLSRDSAGQPLRKTIGHLPEHAADWPENRAKRERGGNGGHK